MPQSTTENVNEREVQRNCSNPQEGTLEIKHLFKNMSNAFDMSKVAVSFNNTTRKEDGQDSFKRQQYHWQNVFYGIYTDDQRQGWGLINS